MEKIQVRMTATEHILKFLEMRYYHGTSLITAHEIQNLSEQSRRVYGKYLGSPSSYDRIFRKLREDGIVEVRELSKKEKPYKTREAIYEIIKVNTHNLFQF